MSVTQVKQSVGSWNVRLRGNIPKAVLDALTPFGHVVIIPGSVNVKEYAGNKLLDAARYVGVYRAKADNEAGTVISGVGLEFWLGDENGAGDVFESPLSFNNASFDIAIRGALPLSAISEGTFYSLPGTYTGTHQWVTPRKVIDYICSVFGAEWRITTRGWLDAGLVSDLYSTTPKAILVARNDSSDLRYKALPGHATMSRDNDQYTTRVVVLGEGEGDTIQVGTANQPSVPYKDLFGGDVVMTRVFSESFSGPTNVDTRAAVLLGQYGAPQAPSVNLGTSTYDIKGDVGVGDYIYVYNPAAGFVDVANEETWNGEIIHPVKLRVVELSWTIRKGWTVAFRDGNGVWTDLSPYVFYEEGETNIIVGDLPRSLSGGGVIEPIGSRPAVDSTIPASPVFGTFSTGSYQSPATNDTRSVIRAQWSTPLNTDGSTILDGAYYEIRYRVSEVLGYSVRWGEVASYRWGQLAGNPWGAPLSAPVSATPEWVYQPVGWGTNEATILELTPAVTYEIQIRAVDAATPPHFGNFSASSFVTTVGDLFAPSTPAGPASVAQGALVIQVTHTLGKSSGGTYNLEPDLVRLNVHVGGSADFYPDGTNQVGELAANAGMILGKIPAVGSFSIPQVETVYVKVVAVDRAGNKSSPSPAVTVTAELIQDKHIGSLTVSKLTAGDLTANTALIADLTVSGSGGIKVKGGGDITITDGSLDVVDALGVKKVEAGLLSDGTYGLAAVNELNQLVPLSRLAFGIKHGYSSSLVWTTDTNYRDPIDESSGYQTFGPVLENVSVGSVGLMVLLLSARIHIGHSLATPVTGTEGYMSFQIQNQATGAVVWSPSDSWSVDFGWSASNTDEVYYASVSTVFPVSGLAAGLYRVIAKYRSIDGGLIRFENRSIIAFPF